MPDRNDTRLPRAARPAADSPAIWARATEAFYGPSFDARTREELVESMADFTDLEPGEQVFVQAYLAFRQVQALEGIYRALRRLEARVEGLDLTALKHVGPIREVLEEMADAQAEIIQAAAPTEPDEADDDEEVEDDVVEEEEHFAEEVPAATEALIPEVLAADDPATRGARIHVGPSAAEGA